MTGNGNDVKSSDTGSARTTDMIFAISIFGTAFLLRLIYLLEISSSPLFENLVIDCARYSDWAKGIAAGNWAGDSVFYQSPLYAYFLGFIYRFVTTDLFAVRVIQALIGSGSCVLVFLITRRLFDRSTALLAGILCAAFAPFIYYDAMIMKTVLSIFLAALGLYLLLRATDSGRTATWIACGVAWGMAGLVRENYILVAAAFAVWYFFRYLTDRQASLRPAFFFAAGVALAILPVTIRNIAVGGEFAIVTSQAGQNFYIGNNSANRTGAYEVPGFVIANPYWEEKSFREQAEKSEGRKMSSNEVSAFYRNLAFEWWSEKPGPALVLLGKKFLLFFNNYEVADNQSIYFMERYSTLMSLNILRFGIIMPFGILGLVLLWRRRKDFAPFYIFGILYSASVIAFFIFGRYRLPLMLALLPPASHAVFWIAGNLRARNWKALWKPAILVACLYAFAFLPAYGYHDEVMAMRFINLGQVHTRIGGELQDSGRQEQAAVQFRLALDAFVEARNLLPDAAEPHLFAARTLTRADMLTRAEKQYRIAISKSPRLVSARTGLAELLFDTRIRAFFEAHDELVKALDIEPDNAIAKELYAKIDDALVDTVFYQEILEDNPDDKWALTYHGIASLFNRDRETAFASIQKALKLDADYLPANNAMALAFTHINKHDEALFYARRVLKLGGAVWAEARDTLESCPDHNHDLDNTAPSAPVEDKRDR